MTAWARCFPAWRAAFSRSELDTRIDDGDGVEQQRLAFGGLLPKSAPAPVVVSIREGLGPPFCLKAPCRKAMFFRGQIEPWSSVGI